MTTFTAPPRSTIQVARQGDTNLLAFAIQKSLNFMTDLDLPKLTVDGAFGPATRVAVQEYQRLVELAPDGVVGPLTQQKICTSLRFRIDPKVQVPKGLMDNLMQGESGRKLAAVNWSKSGGVDCGATQRRVLVPFNVGLLADAFDAPLQIQLFKAHLLDEHMTYMNYAAVKARSDRSEYAWRLGMLSHNWPWGAGELAAGRKLPAKNAWATDIIGYKNGEPVYGWIPVNAKFADGAQVRTYAEWAQFYAIGSHAHNHAGLVVATAFGVPR